MSRAPWSRGEGPARRGASGPGARTELNAPPPLTGKWFILCRVNFAAIKNKQKKTTFFSLNNDANVCRLEERAAIYPLR